LGKSDGDPAANVRTVKALGQVIEPVGLTLEDVGDTANIFGSDPLFSSSVRLAEAFSVAAMAVSAAAI